MLDFFADGELQVALDTDYGEDEDREVDMFGVKFKVFCFTTSSSSFSSTTVLFNYIMPMIGKPVSYFSG